MIVHYFRVNGRIIERRNVRESDAPLSADEARCFVLGVAQEAANYANVPINWEVEDRADGWCAISSQWSKAIGKFEVQYLGTTDPRTVKQTTYAEDSRHSDYGDAEKRAGELKAAGAEAQIWHDSYATTPHRVMVVTQ